jgi:hypothetical protein
MHSSDLNLAIYQNKNILEFLPYYNIEKNLHLYHLNLSDMTREKDYYILSLSIKLLL